MKNAGLSIALLITLLVGGCGNKGDLFLEPIELTEEQKQLLKELEDERNKKSDAQKTSKTTGQTNGESAIDTDAKPELNTE